MFIIIIGKHPSVAQWMHARVYTDVNTSSNLTPDSIFKIFFTRLKSPVNFLGCTCKIGRTLGCGIILNEYKNIGALIIELVKLLS